MNIIACFKVVPEEQDITANAKGDICLDKAKLAISNYDLNCIEAGALLTEEKKGKLVALTVGSTKINDSKLKKNVLSRGPESLYLVADEQLDQMDTHQTAQVLKAGVEKIGEYDLILCGEGSADLYAQQVGVQLGELLHVPTINGVNKIMEEDGKVIVERVLEDEIETLELSLPAVVSVTSDINLPRIPGMKQILSAGKKPTTNWTLQDVNIDNPENTIDILELKAPPQADRMRDIMDGDSDEAIQQFIAKIAGKLN